MIEKIFNRSRSWKQRMISYLQLPESFMQSGFAEIITGSGITLEKFRELCLLATNEIGTFSYEEINYLHQVQAYRIVLEIMCDREIHPRGEVFWLKHSDFPEIVFERVSSAVEIYKAYVVDAKLAHSGEAGDSLLIWVSDLQRIADIVFVSQIPPEVETKRQNWYRKQNVLSAEK